ncbi:MAG: shikimate kinase [Anaerocolumna sp.]
MNNIVLIGFMGCGKTSVGIQLAKKLAFHFYDTDQIIEDSCQRTISSIFAAEGEGFFRKLETKTIKDFIGNLQDTVLSVGGGLPVQNGNAELLRQLGQVIYLETSKETIIKRLSDDTSRPLLSGGDTESKIDTLLKLRAPVYEAAAHVTVTTDNRIFEDIINEIIMKTGVKP